MGLQGGTARCYDWWMDYLKVSCTHHWPAVATTSRPFLKSHPERMRVQCLDESKAPMINMRKQECKEWLDDYNECLHHAKLVSGERSGVGSMLQ